MPPFGSNGPLWSLAYEFWYYVLFAGIWVAMFSRSGMRARVVAGLVVVLGLVVVSGDILVLSGVWLLGVVAYLVWKKVPIRGLPSLVVLAMGLVATLACLVALRVDFFGSMGAPGWCGQYLLGASFALCVWASLEVKRESLLLRVGGFFSKFSYSLYLVHLPVLSLLVVPFIAGNAERMTPGAKSYVIFGGVVLVLYVLGYLFYVVTEKRTGRLRRWLTRRQGSE